MKNKKGKQLICGKERHRPQAAGNCPACQQAARGGRISREAGEQVRESSEGGAWPGAGPPASYLATPA